MRDSFTYKREWTDSLRALPVQVRGEVNEAIIAYGISEELIPLKAMARAVFTLIKADMDRDMETCTKTEKETEKETENEKEKLPHTPYKEKDKEKEKEKEKAAPISHARTCTREENAAAAAKAKRFVKPTVEEVARYCRERNNGIDPDCFVDFYTANGWVQGRQGKPLKDWKAAVRTWEKRRKPETYSYGTTTTDSPAAAFGAAAGRDSTREAERQQRLRDYAGIAAGFAGGGDAEAVADQGSPLGDIPR